MNFTEEEKNIEIKGSYIDLILGKEAEILNIMKPYGVYVLKKNKVNNIKSLHLKYLVRRLFMDL